MSIAIPTNVTFALSRKGLMVSGLSSLPAMCLPARPDIVAVRDIPAANAFEIIFDDIYDIRIQDFLERGAERYRVVGVATYDTPYGAHTEVVGERRWGTD